MHEDPTRRMDLPEPGMPGAGGYGQEPPRDGLSSGMKVLIGILVAAILGLGAALLVVASDDDDATTTSPTTTEPTTTQPTDTTTTAETTETTTPTETTPTETTTTAETTTPTTSTVTDLGTITEGSGGTESP